MPGQRPCAVVLPLGFSTVNGHKTWWWVKLVAFWRLPKPKVSPKGTTLPVPVQGGCAPSRVGVGRVEQVEGCAAPVVTRVFGIAGEAAAVPSGAKRCHLRLASLNSPLLETETFL